MLISNETEATGAARARRPGMNRPPRVLVVEDEHDIATLVKHTLERGGEAQVELVASGDAAIRLPSAS